MYHILKKYEHKAVFPTTHIRRLIGGMVCELVPGGNLRITRKAVDVLRFWLEKNLHNVVVGAVAETNRSKKKTLSGSALLQNIKGWGKDQPSDPLIDFTSAFPAESSKLMREAGLTLRDE
jgi:histone H3/H4